MSFEATEARMRRASDWLCLAGGWTLIALAFWIVINVLLRKFASFSFQGVDEIGGYCLAIVAAAGFAKAAFDRAHVRIDVVTRLFPAKSRAIFDVVALLLLGTMAWMLAWKAGVLTYESWRMGARAASSLRTPVWIPQALWALALFWFSAVLVFQLAWALRALLKGDFDIIEEKIGQADIEREVEAELEEARSRLAYQTKETK